MDRNEIPQDQRRLGVPLGVSITISKLVVRSVQTMYLSYINISTLQMDQSEHPQEPHHLGVPPGASKSISEDMARLAQIMHLSCPDTNTVSKWTETRF
jgi:hypothetical protein